MTEQQQRTALRVTWMLGDAKRNLMGAITVAGSTMGFAGEERRITKLVQRVEAIQAKLRERTGT